MFDTLAFEAFADDLGKRIHVRLGDICNLQSGRIDAVATAHAGYYRYVECLAFLYNIELGRYRVNSVNHIIVIAKVKGLGCFGKIEHLMFVDDAVRIDLMNSSLAYIDLAHTDSLVSCDKLSVDIGQTDVIVIDNIKGSDA